MKAKVEIGKFESAERTGNSEATVYLLTFYKGGSIRKSVGFITGVRQNVGSLLMPRWQITSYDVDVDIDDVNIVKEFATRGEATAFVRSLFA